MDTKVFVFHAYADRYGDLHVRFLGDRIPLALEDLRILKVAVREKPITIYVCYTDDIKEHDWFWVESVVYREVSLWHFDHFGRYLSFNEAE